MITPLDTGRYGSPHMRQLFDDRHRYQLLITVEGAVASAQGRYGMIPAEAAELIAERARTHRCDLDRIAVAEETGRHELVAVVGEFAATCAPHGRYVHFGVTSSDILDTAMAIQLAEAADLLEHRLRELLTSLRQSIERSGDNVMIGRTHGQHAQPITWGFKVAIWLDQIARCLQRLTEVRSRAVMGKVAGAVGSLAGLGRQGPQIQQHALAALGLPAPQICSQAVARDRLAEFLCWAALTATCLDNMATEIRNLQRTEIGEVAESFAEGAQIGSSAMPHKRNPVRSERICSLARLVRSLVTPALENVVSWHERDLANSANERFTVPEACILLDEMLITAASVVDGLLLFPDRMRDNLGRSRQAHLSEAVLLLMVAGGMERLTAYRLIQEATRTAADEGRELIAVLAEDTRVVDVTGSDRLVELAKDDADTGWCEALAAATVTKHDDLFLRG